VTLGTGVTAIVLAGGRSTRYGSPKLAAELDGAPLLDHAVRAVTGIADTILVAGAPIASASGGAPGSSPLRWVADEEPFAGPLAALAGALRETTTELAIVVGGDMPRLVPAVLQSMLQRLASDADLDAVLLEEPAADSAAGPAAHASRRQVLPLALRVKPAFAAAIDARRADERSLARLLDRVPWIEIPGAEWLVLDPAGRTLLDIDRPVDLERIQRELR
jgi:molybdopterin-guanine dinucleotide biosynthesis protein A